MARIIWRIVQVSFNISPPLSIFYMFNGWLNGINKELMYKILVGASALCWTIWLSRNDMVFNNFRAVTPLQVIFRGTHWIRFWALLQMEDNLTFLWVVVCLRPRLWRSLPQLDGLLVIELLSGEFRLVFDTVTLSFELGTYLCVITYNYMYSFM